MVSLPKGITHKKIFMKKGSIERSGRRYFRGRKSFGNKDLESNGFRKGIKTLFFSQVNIQPQKKKHYLEAK